MRHLTAAILALALTACGGGDADEQAQEGADVAEAITPVENATLDLQANGIIIPAQSGEEQLDLPFGSSSAAVEASLERVIGTPVPAEAAEECGAGMMTALEFPGLNLMFEDDKFVGYFARYPYVPDMTREQMLADPGVALVEGSTVGPEFTIGDVSGPVISGLFAGEEQGSAVDALWAGNACVMR